jgi:ATP-binding cassette subfamily A (ABC1) protein 3
MFNLPESQSSQFAALFDALEHRKNSLNILNFGLSVTSMEDVFLKVGSLSHSEEQEEEDPHVNGSLKSNGYDKHNETNGGGLHSNLVRLTGFQLWLSQMKGLLIKRSIYTRRRWLLYGVMVNSIHV